MNFGFTYAGIVADNKDPLMRGRLKVRVPHVFGSDSSGVGSIPLNDLPWALPAGMPAGESGSSGGFSLLPSPGDNVWVRFLDGEPEKPIWEWGMQTVDEPLNLRLKVHRYALGMPVGAPDRTFWTRYNNAIEINEGSIIATTSQGYRLVLTDATDVGTMDGKITLTTLMGNFIELDDLDNTVKINVLEDLYFTVENDVLGISSGFAWAAMTHDIQLAAVFGGYTLTSMKDIVQATASNVLIEALGNTSLITGGDFMLSFSNLKLGLLATEPAVLGTQLTAFLESLFVYLSSHTHTSSTPGSPTSPPMIPPFGVVQPDIALLTSKTVLVQS